MVHRFRLHRDRLQRPLHRLLFTFRWMNKMATRAAVILLLGCIGLSLVHRIVPFPLPGGPSPVTVSASLSTTHRHTQTLSVTPGSGFGGAFVSVPVASGPQPTPQPVPTPSQITTQPTPVVSQPPVSTQPAQPPDSSNPLEWFYRFITGQAVPDSQTVAQALLFILTALLKAIFGQTVTDFLLKFGSQASFLWSTPPEMTYSNPGLQPIWTGMLTVASGMFLLLFMWNGVLMMWKRSSLDYAAAIETLPRAVLAFFLAAFSKNLLQLMITLNNAFCSDLARPDLGFQLLTTQSTDIVYLLVMGVYTFMGVLLLIMSVVRLGLIAVEFTVAPVCCICFGTKVTEPIARLWLSATMATIFVQFLQALTITVGIKYLTPLVTGALPDQNIVSALTGIAVLYLTLQIPKWLQQAALLSMRDAGGSVTSIVGGSIRSTISAASSAATLLGA